MPEMIIPGTYISVRPEGLISAGRIATGIVGVVGTAASGPVGEPVTLASFSNAREIFGLPDDFGRPEDGSNPLTLVRALSHVYGNGASSVVAVRVAGASRATATFAIQDDASRTVAVLTARTPGSWANEVRVTVEDAEDDCLISGEQVPAPFDKLRYTRVVPSAQNRMRIVRGATRRVENLEIVYRTVAIDQPVAPDSAGRFF